MKQEIAHEAVKASPPAGIALWAWITGLTVSDVVSYATLAYIALQAAYLLWKWRRESKK